MAMQAYVFNAKLDGFKGVRRTIAVRADQSLADLHEALRAAFDWDDDHLYAFWTEGFGRETQQSTSTNSGSRTIPSLAGISRSLVRNARAQWCS
jgi:hypothetical protein